MRKSFSHSGCSHPTQIWLMQVLMQPGGKEHQGMDPNGSTFLGNFLAGLISLIR